MTLNQNVSNVFDETEQAAFHPGHIVPGIDFSNDPLYYRDVYSHIQIRKYQDWADQTLIKSQLIDQLTKYTTIKETLCIK